LRRCASTAQGGKDRQERSFFGLPLVTLKIVAAIPWEALRLWVKGARLVPRPSATGQAAFNTASNTVLASGKSTAYTAPE
jgi:hypothetical protein